MSRLPLVLLLTAFTPWLRAQDSGPYPPIANPEATGRQLAERVRTMPPAQNAEFTGVLRILARDVAPRTVPVSCTLNVGPVRPGSTNWDAVYHTQAVPGTPAETLVVRYYVGSSNQYFFAKTNLSEEGSLTHYRVTGAQLDTPLAGSDFWLGDLGLDFLYWPDQKALKTEMRRGRVCRILQSINPHPSAQGYARVVSWIDVETGGLLQAEAYDKDDRLLKEFSLGSFKKVDGQWQLQDMKIVDVRGHSRTWLEFDLK